MRNTRKSYQSKTRKRCALFSKKRFYCCYSAHYFDELKNFCNTTEKGQFSVLLLQLELGGIVYETSLVMADLSHGLMMPAKERPGQHRSDRYHLLPCQRPDQARVPLEGCKGSTNGQSSLGLEALQTARAGFGLPGFFSLLGIGLLYHQRRTELGHE
jgi:hypothetical protein